LRAKEGVSDPKITEHDQGVALAVVGRVMLVLWRSTPTAERMRMLTRVTERMMAEFPDGYYQVQVIEPTSAPPASEQRKESARLIERMKGSARAIGFVIEGDDARASIVRTILRGMALLSRSELPKHFFKDEPSARKWLGEQLALTAPQLHEIERTFASMRRALPPAR
jgi:hypothetical protein